MIFNSILNLRKIVKPCNYSNKIKTINIPNTSWTATKDCWMFGLLSNTKTTEITTLSINNNDIYSFRSLLSMGVCLYLRKGDVVKVGNGGCSLDIYGCIE